MEQKYLTGENCYLHSQNIPSYFHLKVPNMPLKAVHLSSANNSTLFWIYEKIVELRTF